MKLHEAQFTEGAENMKPSKQLAMILARLEKLDPLAGVIAADVQNELDRAQDRLDNARQDLESAGL
jgi:hypothetical protein